MKLRVLAVGALLATEAAAPPARPPITGIRSVTFLSTRPQAAARFWTGTIGARAAADPEMPDGRRYYVSGRQFVEVLPTESRPQTGMFARVAYFTPDVAAMRRYLTVVGHEAIGPVERSGDGDRWIALRDPEGIEVRFVQAGPAVGSRVPAAISDRIIHAGHLVCDRPAEDRFYRTLLGFRPYWYGGMKAGQVDWVSQQVPDGQEWFEYMLTRPGSPAPDAAAFGGMNHVSLGVPDVRATARRIATEHRPVAASAKPLLGRDGKWQLNLLDPDGSRIELMDFRASVPPCCSPFTAPDPKS